MACCSIMGRGPRRRSATSGTKTEAQPVNDSSLARPLNPARGLPSGGRSCSNSQLRLLLQETRAWNLFLLQPGIRVSGPNGSRTAMCQIVWRPLQGSGVSTSTGSKHQLEGAMAFQYSTRTSAECSCGLCVLLSRVEPAAGMHLTHEPVEQLCWETSLWPPSLAAPPPIRAGLVGHTPPSTLVPQSPSHARTLWLSLSRAQDALLRNRAGAVPSSRIPKNDVAPFNLPCRTGTGGSRQQVACLRHRQDS